VEARSEIGCATDTQAALVDGARMFLHYVVSVDFHIGEAREVRAENASDGAAADDADFDAHAVFRASKPV
jgi:hypothetical protein